MSDLRDAITDVPGICVGHDTDPDAVTGCTVVLCERGAIGGVDVRGAAPGTRETDLLDPTNLVEQVHGVLLTGGSAFGLDAAGGVMRYFAERGVGYDAGSARVPIVPGAVIFDLGIGRADVRPDAESGYRACLAASDADNAMGSVGAGTGATVGKVLGIGRATKGGVGTASIELAGGIVVGALIVVNAVGDVVDPATGRIVAGARGESGFVGAADWLLARAQGRTSDGPVPGANTTIGVIATNARLTKAGAKRIAMMAHDGLALAVRPAHTMFDGDALFALGTDASATPGDTMVIGAAAGLVVSRAIVRAVESATSLGGVPAVRDLIWRVSA